MVHLLQDSTEEYNGTTWTSITPGSKYSKICVRRCRNSNSSFRFWGIYTTANSGATEEYNGSTWTTVPPGLNTARHALAGAGTQTAGWHLVVNSS
jgi:hypothetical protein